MWFILDKSFGLPGIACGQMLLRSYYLAGQVTFAEGVKLDAVRQLAQFQKGTKRQGPLADWEDGEGAGDGRRQKGREAALRL